MAGLEELFIQLPNRQARLDFFARLLPKLDDQDWRDLQSALAVRTFQYDIVGNLPVELFIEVFMNLNANQVLELRQVSKRWHMLLSDIALLKILFGPDIASPNAPLYEEKSIDNMSGMLRRFRRHELFRACKPVWHRQNSRPKYRPHRSIWTGGLKMVDLCGGVTAAIMPRPGNLPIEDRGMGEEVIEVTNLYTRETHTLRGNDRGQIVGLFLTSRICGWMTFNSTCYAYDLVIRETRSFKISSANVDVMSGRDAWLAVIYGSHDTGVFTLHLWNWDTQVSRTFDFLMPMKLRGEVPYGLVIDQSGTRITVFTYGGGLLNYDIGTYGRHIRFHTYTLDGAIVAYGKSSLPYHFMSHCALQVRPCNTDGQYSVSTIYMGSGNGKFHISTIFNEHKLAFEHRAYPNPINTPRDCHNWLLWRDTVYSIGDSNEEAATQTLHVFNYNLKRSDVKLSGNGLGGTHSTSTHINEDTHIAGSATPWLTLTRNSGPRDEYDVVHHAGTNICASHRFAAPRILANDTFLVVTYESDLQHFTHVLCFEDGFAPPDGDDIQTKSVYSVGDWRSW